MTENFNLVQTISVNKLPNGNLHSQCSHLGTSEEASAWITTDTQNLRITGAGLEVYRSPGEKPGYRTFPELVGMEAYVHSGAEIKTIIGPDDQIARSLLLECIKGIIQVESFIYIERGYPSLSAYQDHWCSISQNSCYTFSHLKDGRSGWYVDPRHYNLFSRTHVINVYKENIQKRLYGTFIDTFHELNIRLILDNDNVVLDASADFIRIPSDKCHNSAIRLENLVGRNLPEMSKKQIKLLIGGPEGCIHLAEIVYHAFLMINSSM